MTKADDDWFRAEMARVCPVCGCNSFRSNERNAMKGGEVQVYWTCIRCDVEALPASHIETIAAEVLKCAVAHEPNVLLMGNVRADDVAKLAASVVEQRSSNPQSAYATMSTTSDTLVVNGKEYVPRSGSAQTSCAHCVKLQGEIARLRIVAGNERDLREAAERTLKELDAAGQAFLSLSEASPCARPDRDHPEDDYADESDRMQEAAARNACKACGGRPAHLCSVCGASRVADSSCSDSAKLARIRQIINWTAITTDHRERQVTQIIAVLDGSDQFTSPAKEKP